MFFIFPIPFRKRFGVVSSTSLDFHLPLLCVWCCGLFWLCLLHQFRLTTRSLADFCCCFSRLQISAICMCHWLVVVWRIRQVSPVVCCCMGIVLVCFCTIWACISTCCMIVHLWCWLVIPCLLQSGYTFGKLIVWSAELIDFWWSMWVLLVWWTTLNLFDSLVPTLCFGHARFGKMI